MNNPHNAAVRRLYRMPGHRASIAEAFRGDLDLDDVEYERDHRHTPVPDRAAAILTLIELSKFTQDERESVVAELLRRSRRGGS